MAIIQNDRDIELQATSPRLITVSLPDNLVVPGAKAIKLSATSTVFKVNTSGVSNISEITLVASLIYIDDALPITFSIVNGLATLTGTGADSRTLTFANLQSSSVVVRASVTDAGTTYTDDITIIKVEDGSIGTRTAVLDMYKWSATTPTTFPQGTSVYTWATAQFTDPNINTNGWTRAVGNGSPGDTLWVARRTYVDQTTDLTSNITWNVTSAISVGTNPQNPIRSASITLYQWASTQPALPVGTSTYTWASTFFTMPATPGSWAKTVTSTGQPGQTLYAVTVAFANSDTTATTSNIDWATGTITVEGFTPLNATRTTTLSLYQWANSQPTAPSGTSTYTWATSTFTDPTGIGSWVRTTTGLGSPGQSLYKATVVYSDTNTSATSSVPWTNVVVTADSYVPLNVTRYAVLKMWQWKQTGTPAPTTFPTGNSTWVWSTGAFTDPATLNSWTQNPVSPGPGYTLYSVEFTYSDQLTTLSTIITWPTTGLTAVVEGYTAENATRSVNLELYKWSATVPTTFPSGTSTYTWSTDTFTRPVTHNDWNFLSTLTPVQGQTLYKCIAVYTDKLTTATSTVTWPATNSAIAVSYAAIDGQDGTGAPGTRGAYSNTFGTPFGIYFSGTTWNEGINNTNANLASRVIWLLVNNATTPITGLATYDHLVNGDTVTLQSSDGIYVKTMTWQNGAWKYPGTVIDGNLLVTNTIDGNKIQANTVSASKINARGLSILDTAGNVILSAGASINASQLNGVNIPTITTATANFNNRNDRDATTVVAPVVADAASTVDHTINTDGSANIQFNWTWGGVEADIDGFIVYIKSHGTAAPTSRFTTWTDISVSSYYIPAFNRSFLLNGVAADYYYTFAVRAYRQVDPDISTNEILYSTIAQPPAETDAANEFNNGAYRPSSNISFAGTLTGNATGTINGLASSNYLNSNISLSGSNGTITLSGAAAGSTATGVVMPGNPISTSNVTTYISGAAIGTAQIANLAVGTAQIANAAVENAKIGNFIASTNYDGSTTNPFTTPGTAGWCIAKNADAVFNKIVIRRPLRAAGGTYTGNSTNDGYLYTWSDPKTGSGGWTGTIRAVIDTGIDDTWTLTDQNAPHYVAKALISGVTLQANQNQFTVNQATPPITTEVSVGTLSTLKANAINSGTYTLGLQTGQPSSGRVYIIVTITPANARQLLAVSGASALYLDSVDWSLYRVT